MSFLIYDGDCPFCSRYVDYLEVKKRHPELELINARENPQHEAVKQVKAQGLVLDEGMALVDGKHIRHGAEAMRFLSQDHKHGLFFRARPVATRLYTVLKFGRALTLKALRKGKLGF